ncbi:MAG: hypothetical protein ACRD4S_14505 [Candidatus Acidiferrales bacterium]
MEEKKQEFHDISRSSASSSANAGTPAGGIGGNATDVDFDDLLRRAHLLLLAAGGTSEGE